MRQFLRRHVVFHQCFSWLRPRYREYGVRRDTHVVIEGYPRSANTFAVVAFKLAQPGPVKIGRHLHSLGQVRRAVDLTIPTLILIREPRDAVASLAIARNDLRLEYPLQEYIEYYEGIAALGDAVVLAEFREITRDFGEATRRLNRRFGTQFGEFVPTKENMKRCYELIDEEDRANNEARRVRPTRVARPTTERSQQKQEVLELFETPRNSELLSRAENTYRRLLEQHGLHAFLSSGNAESGRNTENISS